MTLLNVIGILVTAAIIIVAVVTYRKIRGSIKDADGLGDVNTRGKASSSDAGDEVASISIGDGKRTK